MYAVHVCRFMQRLNTNAMCSGLVSTADWFFGKELAVVVKNLLKTRHVFGLRSYPALRRKRVGVAQITGMLLSLAIRGNSGARPAPLLPC